MTAPAKHSDSTAVATTSDSKAVMRLLSLDDARAYITPFLRGADFNQVLAEVRIAISKNPEIAKCDPASIVLAVADAVGTGGIIGKDVHLVPFGPKLQALTDYKFEARLIVGTGAASALDAYCLYAKEPFEYEYGTQPFVKHRPILDPAQRGEMVGVYAVARVRFGHVKIHVMAYDEVDAIRQRCSKQWKKGDVPDWYMKKTAIRQLAKLLPQNQKLAELLQRVRPDDFDKLDEAEAIESPTRPALPARSINGASMQAVHGYDGDDSPMGQVASPQRINTGDARDIDDDTELLAEAREIQRQDAEADGELALGNTRRTRRQTD